MRHVFNTMGTTATIDAVRMNGQTIRRVEAVFSQLDARFSLYRADSELSRVAVGTLPLTSASAELRDVYADAIHWRHETGGAFTPHRPDGVVDLNGIVKAIGMRDAAAILRVAGSRSWCLNVGGDVLCNGEASTGQAWTAGIVDPVDRTRLLLAVSLGIGRRAAATSGGAERGEHIWRAVGHDVPTFNQVTVLADDIVLADVLATAIVAGGRSSLDELADRFAVDVLTVSPTGELTATPGFRAALAA